MPYLVLARKYRPQTFDEVVGQEEVGKTLKRSIEQDRVGHAYLFCGPRGVGKTSVARIFAKALNCPEARREGGPGRGVPCNRCPVCEDISRGSDVDVIEIDGASNRGIDEVRGIREGAKYLPTRVPFKIYIVDEVHMLTGPAFNALLKTLEEPPPHVMFLFATTNPQALPETVRSRCQRFDFRPIGAPEIVKRLGQICEAEKATAEPSALELIAALAEGGMRDAQSLLDQMIAYGEGSVRRDDVEKMLGLPPMQTCLDLLTALSRGDAAAALRLVDQVVRAGGDPEDLADRLERLARDLLVLATVDEPGELHLLSGADPDALKPLCHELFPPDALAYLVRLLLAARDAMRAPGPTRVALELALVRAAALKDLVPLEEVVGAVRALRDSGSGSAGPTESRPPGARPVSTEPENVSGARADPVRPAAPPRAATSPPGRAPTSRHAGDPARKIDAADLAGRWADVVREIIRARPSLGSLLSRSRFQRLEGNVLTVELPPRNRFGLEQLSQPENLRAVQELLLAVTGQSMTPAYVLAPSDAAGGTDASTEAAVRRSPKRPEEGVKRVLEIFDGHELFPEPERESDSESRPDAP